MLSCRIEEVKEDRPCGGNQFMQCKWQLWLGCVLLLIITWIGFGGYGNLTPVTAAALGPVAQRTTHAVIANTDRPFQRLNRQITQPMSVHSPHTPTIIGGEEAAQGAWPWMVALIYATSNDAAQGQFCGGALIDAEWVLSAAHCTYDLSGRPRQPTEIEIVVGRHQLSGTEGQRVAVNWLIRHPGYTENSFDNDLVLLHLVTPVDIPPVPLLQPEQKGYELSGTPVMVLGWGITDGGQDSDVLRQVEVPLVDLRTCRQSYGIFNEKVTDNMLCAGLKTGGKDSCQGDSGGPMIVFEEEGQTWRQLGIVSWGEGCAEPNYYGVYTRVSPYVQWINEHIPSQMAPTMTPVPLTPTLTPPPPTKEATATPQFSATATSTLIPTALSTTVATPTPTVSTAPSTTPAVTPPEARSEHTIYLPMVTMDRFVPLHNGDFEANTDRGWSEFSLQEQSLIIHASAIASSTHGGSHMARLGAERGEIAFIQQTVTVPPAAPILEFWLRIDSTDDCGYDFGGVVVEEQIVAQYDLCRASATTDWQRREVDLRAYSGTTVSLEIRAETDGFLNSTLLVDDVTFLAVTAAQSITAQNGTSHAAESVGDEITRHSATAPRWSPRDR